MNKTKIYSNLLMAACVMSVCHLSNGQYVHPNQPGTAGGATTPAPSNLTSVVATTYYGTNGAGVGQGVLFAADKNGSTSPTNGGANSNFRALHVFKGAANDAGYSWYTSPFTASDGNIYGNSFYGGANNYGGVYKYDVGAAANCSASESLIYSIGSGGSATYGNYANLNELSDGMLYLPETAGGPTVYGVLRKFSKTGTGATSLHNFNWGVNGQGANYTPGAKLQPNYATYAALASDGAYPYGFPVEGPDGYVYGTTYWGGVGGAGIAYGTVYKIKKDGTDYKILAYGGYYAVGNYNSADGSTVANVMPFAVGAGNVAIDQAGEYGYFFGGYIANQTYGNICRVKLDGTEAVQIVHTFKYTGSNTQPYYLYRGPIIIGNELFGTTYYGGTGAYGTIFKIDLSKLNPTDNPIDATGVNNTLQVLHNFGVTGGQYPFASLIYDGTYLYGSTTAGGYTGTSYGTVFRIKPDGTDFKSIMDFQNAAGPCPNPTVLPDQKYNFAYYVSGERVTLAQVDNSQCFSCITEYPDLTPTPDIDKLEFSSTPLGERDFVVDLFELNVGATSAAIEFTIEPMSGFDISVPDITLSATNQTGINGTSAVNGGRLNENANWLFRINSGIITVTSKPGVKILKAGVASLGFRIKRKSGIALATSNDIKIKISNGTAGGDTEVSNNLSYTTVTTNK